MYCPECRAELPDGAKFCFRCVYDFQKIKTPPEKKVSDNSLDSLKTSSKPPASSDDSLGIFGTSVRPGLDVTDLEAGSLFANRYEILSEGKRGGMGVVYKCRDRKLNRLKALKIRRCSKVT